MTRIMALDVGDARIGVALSDPLGVIAQPFETIVRADKYIDKLIEIIVRCSVSEVIVGFPLELDGTVGLQAGKVYGFVKKLNAALIRQLHGCEIPVRLLDERFSTAQAERIVAGSGLRDKERSSAVDRISAAIILESYLMRISGPSGSS